MDATGRVSVCIKYRESASHGFVVILFDFVMCYHIDYNTNHVKFIKIFNNKKNKSIHFILQSNAFKANPDMGTE